MAQRKQYNVGQLGSLRGASVSAEKQNTRIADRTVDTTSAIISTGKSNASALKSAFNFVGGAIEKEGKKRYDEEVKKMEAEAKSLAMSFLGNEDEALRNGEILKGSSNLFQNAFNYQLASQRGQSIIQEINSKINDIPDEELSEWTSAEANNQVRGVISEYLKTFDQQPSVYNDRLTGMITQSYGALTESLITRQETIKENKMLETTGVNIVKDIQNNGFRPENIQMYLATADKGGVDRKRLKTTYVNALTSVEDINVIRQALAHSAATKDPAMKLSVEQVESLKNKERTLVTRARQDKWESIRTQEHNLKMQFRGARELVTDDVMANPYKTSAEIRAMVKEQYPDMGDVEIDSLVVDVRAGRNSVQDSEWNQANRMVIQGAIEAKAQGTQAFIDFVEKLEDNPRLYAQVMYDRNGKPNTYLQNLLANAEKVTSEDAANMSSQAVTSFDNAYKTVTSSTGVADSTPGAPGVMSEQTKQRLATDTAYLKSEVDQMMQEEILAGVENVQNSADVEAFVQSPQFQNKIMNRIGGLFDDLRDQKISQGYNMNSESIKALNKLQMEFNNQFATGNTARSAYVGGGLAGQNVAPTPAAESAVAVDMPSNRAVGYTPIDASEFAPTPMEKLTEGLDAGQKAAAELAYDTALAEGKDPTVALQAAQSVQSAPREVVDDTPTTEKPYNFYTTGLGLIGETIPNKVVDVASKEIFGTTPSEALLDWWNGEDLPPIQQEAINNNKKVNDIPSGSQSVFAVEGKPVVWPKEVFIEYRKFRVELNNDIISGKIDAEKNLKSIRGDGTYSEEGYYPVFNPITGKTTNITMREDTYINMEQKVQDFMSELLSNKE